MGVGIIEYLCVNSTHNITADVPEPVVVHEGALAYCPMGDVDGHEWCRTGGKTLATVREWLGRPEPRSASAKNQTAA